MAGRPPPPSPPAAVEAFLQRRDLASLGKAPLVFEQAPRFAGYLCCFAWLRGVGSWGGFCVKEPIITFCPCTLKRYFALELGADALRLHSARNDCLCHVVHPEPRAVPLRSVLGVELKPRDWVEDCCGAELLEIRVAGEATPIKVPYLKAPAQARDAILLAAQLHSAQQATEAGGGGGSGSAAASAAPAQAAMQRGQGAGNDGTLEARLAALEELVAKGALTKEEAGAVRARVLAAGEDLTPRLLEAAGLKERGAISAAEFNEIKAKSLAQG